MAGHFCRICGCRKSNESFSGRGHATHVCQKCARMPKERRENIEAQDELFRFLKQSHISDKNVSRLKVLMASADAEVAELAAVVLAVAEVHPYKRRRLKFLARNRRDLIEKLDSTGLIFAHHF